MSEPIFRAFNNKTKEWIKNFCVKQDGDLLRVVFSNLTGNVLTVDLKDATLCRSTGLKDKNGVVIFEGDIVKFDDFNPDHCEGDYLPRQIFEVSLKRIRFWLKEEMFGHEGELLLNSNDCEVIGNIFSNPELLEQKQ